MTRPLTQADTRALGNAVRLAQLVRSISASAQPPMSRVRSYIRWRRYQQPRHIFDILRELFRR